MPRNTPSVTSSNATAQTRSRLVATGICPTHRVLERQAKALAHCPTTTAMNAAPDAASSACPAGKASPGRQPSARKVARNAAISTTASVGAEHTEHADEERAVDQVPAERRSVERMGCRRLGAQGQGGEHVRADVERQDLEHAQGQREAASRERPDHERRELGHVVGEVVGEEPADVGVGRSPLLDGGDDGGEVVVQQDEVRGLAGDVGAGSAHRDPDVGLLQRRAVVDAVTGHRHHVPSGPERAGDAQLALRRHPAHDHAVAIEEGSEHRLVVREVAVLQDDRVRAGAGRPRGRWPALSPGDRR